MSAIEQLSGIVRNLCRRCGDAPTDGELLAQFASRRDEAAFAELVRRHGPLVLSVATRHLPDRQAAEDVVQATFLALARRAARLGRPPSLVNWLYTVAVRQARLVQRASMRHTAVLKRMPSAAPARDPLAEVSGRELLTIIDEELTRLPEIYLLPLLLCAVEGHSREEAARRLGWPAGSVKGRLERGRELLRKRLAARGLTVPAVLAGGLLTSPVVALPRALANAVVRMAIVAPIAGGSAKLVVAIAMVLTAIGIGAGAMGLLGGGVSQPPVKEKPPAPTAAVAVPEAPKLHVDAEGVPLPDNALMRFGSSRFRHGPYIFTSALSPDGKRLATSARQSVAVWDLATGRMIRHFKCDESALFHGELAFSADGMRLAYVRNVACVWDLETGSEVWRLAKDPRVKGAFQSHCRFTADGRELILREGEQTVYRDLRTGEVTRTLPVSGVELMSPDLRTYVRVENEQAVIVGDVGAGKDVKRLEGRLAPHVVGNLPSTSLAFSVDGKTLAVAHLNKELQIYDLPAGTIRAAFPLPDSAHYKWGDSEHWDYRVAFSPDGKTLVLGTAGGRIHRWDIASRKELPVLRKPLTVDGRANIVSEVHVLPDNRTLVSTGWDGRIRVWDLLKNEEILEPGTYSGRISTAYSPDGRLVAMADCSGRIDLRSAGTGKCVQTIRRDGPAVRSLAFAPDGRTLAAGQSSGGTQLWELPSGRESKSFREESDDHWTPSSNLYCARDTLLFTPDGRSLYVNYYPDRSQMWDVATGKLRWRWPNYSGGAAICPDGSSIIVSRMTVIGHLDIATGKYRRKDRIGDDEITVVAVSANGQLFAAPVDGKIVVCDVSTGREVRSWEVIEQPTGQMKALAQVEGRMPRVTAAALSAAGQYLATAADNGTIRVWDIFASQKILQFEGHEGDVTVLTFGPDGSTLLSAGDDGQAFLWSLKPPPSPAATLDSLWGDLAAGVDAVKTYRALWALSADPKAVEFLRTKVPPIAMPDRERMAKFIADLDSNQFKTRDAATKALADEGKPAVPFLEEAIKGQLSPEAQRRVQGLIEASKQWPIAVEVRQVRAVRALELAGTPAAREHLKALAGGAASATLTQAAAQALKRLGP